MIVARTGQGGGSAMQDEIHAGSGMRTMVEKGMC